MLTCRASEQNFEEVHSRLKRGDILGITGNPGELCNITTHASNLFYSPSPTHRKDQERGTEHSPPGGDPAGPLPAYAATLHYGLKDKETRFRQRYLDLIMNQQVRDKFIVR